MFMAPALQGPGKRNPFEACRIGIVPVSRSKRIVCLANSRKLSGRCIAGREWTEEEGVGSWVRSVSAREHQEVSEYERQYEDGSDPRVLDIIEIPVLEPLPRDCQTENWLLDPQHYWERTGTYSPLDLPALTDPVEPFWIDGYSTHHGRNDRIPVDSTDSITSSLRLIRVDELGLEVFMPGDAFGNTKRRVQGRFAHSGQEYAFWVTDPQYERRYLAKLDGSYRLGECYLTISLGEPHEGFFYKLIAALIEPDRW